MPREIKDTYAETWAFSSEGCFMYPVGKVLVPPLRSLGVTPNMLTIFNIFVGASAAYAMASAWAVSAVFLVLLHQLIDAMDGTMARMFKMGSKFGAKLDEFTDICFGTSVSVSACICVYPNQYAVAGQVAFSLFLLAAAIAYSSAKDDPKRTLKWVEDLTFMEKVGLWGVESMTYTMLMNVIFLHLARVTDAAKGVQHLEISPLLWVICVSLGLVGVVCATDWAEQHFTMFAKNKK